MSLTPLHSTHTHIPTNTAAHKTARTMKHKPANNIPVMRFRTRRQIRTHIRTGTHAAIRIECFRCAVGIVYGHTYCEAAATPK